ncbi:MAG: MoaD/ThiS family protein [Fimbriimonadaceae bacterium]
MRFEVALFAYLREQHGSSVTVEAEPTVAGVLSALTASGIAVDHCRLAVDEAIAEPDTRLTPTSRVAVIPPVSGG